MKSERTEYFSTSVTPEVKKMLDMAKGNMNLEADIIKGMFTDERDWIEKECKEIDEAVVRYRSKLLNIREAFGDAQELYTEQIEDIYLEGDKMVKKLDKLTDPISKKMEAVLNKVSRISALSEGLNYYNIERFCEAVERLNSLPGTQLELIAKLIKGE